MLAKFNKITTRQCGNAYRMNHEQDRNNSHTVMTSLPCWHWYEREPQTYNRK